MVSDFSKLIISVPKGDHFFVGDDKVFVDYVGETYARLRVESSVLVGDRLPVSLGVCYVEVGAASPDRFSVTVAGTVDAHGSFHFRDTRVLVVECGRSTVRLAVCAPRDVSIQRSRVRERYGAGFTRDL